MRISKCENDLVPVCRVWESISTATRFHNHSYVIFDNFKSDDDGRLKSKPNVEFTVVFERIGNPFDTILCTIYFGENHSKEMELLIRETEKFDMDALGYRTASNPMNNAMFEIVSKYIRDRVPEIPLAHKARTLIMNRVVYDGDSAKLSIPYESCWRAWEEKDWVEIF